MRSGAEIPADSARISWEFRDATNANVLGSFDSGVITATTNWQAVAGKRLAPTGTRFIRIRLIGVRNSGVTNDAYFDDGKRIVVGIVVISIYEREIGRHRRCHRQ